MTEPFSVDTSTNEADVFVFPAAFAQVRLWFLDRFEPNSCLYNLPAVVRLTGQVNIAVLEQSFNEIVRRHESLRTTFTTVEEKPVQVIAPTSKFKLALVDLRDLPESVRESRARQLATEEARQPFDLERGALFRVSLLQLAATEYLLLVTMHHIISDGWSMGVLIEEMAALYKAFSCQESSPLPDLPIQYADFAVWQQEWLQNEVLETQLNYWKQQLKATAGLLELPTDRTRPPAQTFAGKTRSYMLSKSLTQPLKDLSRQEDVTLFMTLLAAFKTLLYRYTQEVDILVGSAIANRNRAEAESLIGCFVNTLVLRTDLSGNPSFRELLSRVRETTLAAYQHQDLPFEKLVEELQPERSLSHNPLFQVMFQLRNAPMPALELSGLTLSLLEVEKGSTQFDLSVDIEELEPGLKVSVEHNTDLFDSTTIDRLFGHFQTLLAGIVAHPNQSLSALPLLTAAEHQQLLAWNSKKLDILPELCIHDLFAARVEQNPGAIAVIFEDRQLTYEELNQQANQLAHYLQKLGVKPEVLVGVCVERSLEMVVGILAVLKAGGAYVPLDPAYPQSRLGWMLEDSLVPVLLTGQRLVESLPRNNAKVVCLDTDWELISQESQQNPQSSATPENLVYTIYTSGSTGKPKGVMVEHRSLVNAYLNWEQVYQLHSIRTHLQMASFSFDVFSGDLVRALCSGGKLVLCDRDLLLTPPLLYDLMERQQIESADFVPVVLRNLIQYLEESGKRLDFMKLIICGSDSWYLEEYKKFRQFCAPTTRLINCFGLTEATIDSCYFESATNLSDLEKISPETQNSSFDAAIVPIGKPFANSQLYILDQYKQPVPIGVKGELYIGGAGVARGYLNRPDLTAERFISNLFTDEVSCQESGVRSQESGVRSQESGVRSISPPAPPAPLLPISPSPHLPLPPSLYKTGDKARYLPDGNIEYLGRIDNQVKIRGFRIELGEIEAALLQHPAISEAHVAVVGEQAKQLVAYVVPCDGEMGRWGDGFSSSAPSAPSAPPAQSAPPALHLRDYLHQKLPEYMLPSSFVMLDMLPLTPNGKVDRQALPTPEQARPEKEDFIAPLTPVEKLLAEIWSKMLGVDRVGIHDNFFELGGDSILSIQIVAKANRAGVGITPKQLFAHQTIAQLAAVAGMTEMMHSEQGVVTGAVPLTPIQHWFFEQNFVEPHHWNMAVLLEARQVIDSNILKQVVQQLLKHHDALRLRFVLENGGWQQINADIDEIVPFTHIDLSTLTANEQTQAIASTVDRLQASLNLSTGILVRVALFDLGKDKPNYLSIAIHHLAIDGVSWRILLEDLETIYQQIADNAPIQLPAKTTSFQQWAKRLMEYAQSTQLQQQLDYWLTELHKPVLSLPVDYPGGSNTVASSRTHSVKLGVKETQALLYEVPKVYHTQIDDVLLTALVQAFARWTGERSLLVELESHGREEIFADLDLSRTVGWFTSAFPVFLSLSNTANIGNDLKAVKEQLQKIPDCGMGYGVLRYLSGDRASQQLQALPQPQVCFNYFGQFDQVMSASSLFQSQKSSGLAQSPRGNRSNLLEINSVVTAGQLQLDWSYSQEIYRPETIAHLAESTIAALRSLIAHCQSPDAGGYTPSDFAEFKSSQWSQVEIDEILLAIGEVGNA